MQQNLRHPLLVIILLILASLACYSDSPLWVSELTPAPPTVTPLPLPAAEEAKLAIGDSAIAPAALNEGVFRLDMTRFPEPLKPDLSNRSPQACTQNTVVEVLYSGVDPSGTIYHLIDCAGVAGWAPEARLLGPINILPDDRALTTEAGVNPDTSLYQVELSDPPYREDDPFRQRGTCGVNQTVDVVDISAFSTGEVYYKIRCTDPQNPVLQQLGWVQQDGLLGPVRFRNREVGIVPQETDEISLLAEPLSDEVLGTCETGQRVEIGSTPVQIIQGDLFYEVSCGDVSGWVNQNLVAGPVVLSVGDLTLLTAPDVINSATVNQAETEPEAADASAEPATPLPDATLEPAVEIMTTVPMTTDPEPFTGDNAVASCEDATIVEVMGIAGLGGDLLIQIECDGETGWVPEDVLFGVVAYEIGETVPLDERALLGFGQQGLYLSVNLFDIEGASGGSDVIAGECNFDFETREAVDATLVDIGYYRSSTGDVVGIFYRAQCENPAGETIEGWINQDRIEG